MIYLSVELFITEFNICSEGEMEQKFDIIVAGGGFAGFAASVAAARQGKNVLLIEKYNCLGGAAVFRRLTRRRRRCA